MKANFYTIINPIAQNEQAGGGHRSGRIIIDNIKECGFDIEIITPHDEWKSPNDCDLIIMHDPFNDPKGSQWFNGDQLDQILESKTPMLWSECAYTSFTKSDYGGLDPSTGKINYVDDLQNISVPLIKKSKVVLASSPLHRDEMTRYMGAAHPNYFLYIREVNTELFDPEKYKNHNSRSIDYLYVGAANWFKGADKIQSYMTDNKIIIAVGPGFQHIVKHDELPKLYAQAKNFIHLPRWKEPFGRTVAEASLCGCNIIGNSNVGALSWGLDLSDPSIYEKGKENFKEMIYENFIH